MTMDYTYSSQKTNINTALGTKANASEVYTTTQTYTQDKVDELVGDKITLTSLAFTLRNYLYQSEEFTNGLRVAWKDSSNNDRDLILVKLSTFQDLETRVSQLEQQVGTLFNQDAATDTAVTTAQAQIQIINNFAQNALQRLAAAGL